MKEKILYLLTAATQRIINGSKKVNPAIIKNILVVKLDDIGDMVYSLHVFSMLQKQFPDANITVFCKPVNHIFFKYVNGIEVLDSTKDKLPSNQDVVIDLRGNFKSLWHAFSKGCSFYFDRGSVRMRNKYSGGQKQEVHTNHQIIEDLLKDTSFEYPRIEISQAETDSVNTWLSNNNIEKFAVLHTGANDTARRWPKHRFVALAKHLLAKEFEIVFVGTEADRNEIESIMFDIPEKTFTCAGEFNLLELAALCKRANLFVGNESGPVHIATAMDTPLVALFGPGVRNVFYPYHKQARIIHPFPENNPESKTGGKMTQISVEEVVEAVESLAV